MGILSVPTSKGSWSEYCSPTQIPHLMFVTVWCLCLGGRVTFEAPYWPNSWALPLTVGAAWVGTAHGLTQPHSSSLAGNATLKLLFFGEKNSWKKLPPDNWFYSDLCDWEKVRQPCEPASSPNSISSWWWLFSVLHPAPLGFGFRTLDFAPCSWKEGASFGGVIQPGPG